MEQFNHFNLEKQVVIAKLNQLKGILIELKDIGVDIDDGLLKIEAALLGVDNEVLRIALLGAFSDGKTSVVAGWLGKIMDDMNIDMDESSDQLAIYKPEGLPDKCEIIDTPGLFGDKEKTIDGEQVMYSDLTKRYISEAHLIFYVVDATNPLKDSHKDIAKYILRDLNKLPTTIFIINKMDEVTDLTEQQMFDEQATIKKQTLTEKLQRVANLNKQEVEQLNITCIASNPNGRGLPFWFGKPAHYESRSRINNLKAMTTEILDRNVPEALIAKTGMDVVQDVVGQKIKVANRQLVLMQSYYHQNREETQRITEDINKGRSEVKRLGKELYFELETMEKQLLGKLRPLSSEDIKAYLEDEIGYIETDEEVDVGFKLTTKIKVSIDNLFEQSSSVTRRLSSEIESHLDASESFFNSISQDAINTAGNMAKGLSKVPTCVIKDAIFASRDALATVTGTMIKFKPWEATKLAGSISKWAGPIGAIITLASDLFSAHKAHEQEQKLQGMKHDIAQMIKGAFKDIYDLISDDNKLFDSFAPQLESLEKVVVEMNAGAEEVESNLLKIKTAEQQLQSLNNVEVHK
jgi:hypothetical protein